MNCWQPTLTAAGTQQPGEEDLGSLASHLGTTSLLSGKGLIGWFQVGWEGCRRDGVAPWLSTQGLEANRAGFESDSGMLRLPPAVVQLAGHGADET